MPSDLLCGRVAGLEIDVPALLSYYREVVEPAPATQYHDNDAAYEGWSLTSRDGSTADGVKRIDRKVRQQTGDNRRCTIPTSLYNGYLAEVIDRLKGLGFRPHRVRIMRLACEGFEMKWHRDDERESWRLHVPIATNEHSRFEWRLDDGSQRSLHLPADGSGWLVRVDELHRAVNRGAGGGMRVHLLMSLTTIPPREAFAPPIHIKADAVATR